VQIKLLFQLRHAYACMHVLRHHTDLTHATQLDRSRPENEAASATMTPAHTPSEVACLAHMYV
jgi:hypothetical protein